MKSKLFTLNTRDFVKGLFVFVLSSVLTALLQVMETKGLSLAAADWQSILQVASIAALSYLSKNLMSDENDKIGGAF